jgi:hypothetical protein
MKTLMRWAARLYPASWRRRYAVELEALLDDVGPGGRDLWDILRGALLMHLRMTGVGFWKILAACALAGVLAAGIWSAMLHDRYVSTAVMRLNVAPPSSPADPRWAVMHHLLIMEQSVLSRSSLSSIIQQQSLYPDERKKLPLEDIVLLMRNRDLRIQPTASAGQSAFTVEFTGENPAAAQATVNAIVRAFVEENLRVSRGGIDRANLEVLDPGSLPSRPTGPNRLRVIGSGLGAGLLLGLLSGGIWTVVRRQKRLTIRRIGGFALAGMLAGLIIAYFIPNEFVSMAVLHSARENTLRTTIQYVLSDDSLAAIARRNNLYPTELSNGGIHAVTRKMRESIRVENFHGSETGARGTFVVSFTYPDRGKTYETVRDLAALFTGVPQSPTEILDPASYPDGPFFPNRRVIALMGTIAGVFLGVAASHLRKPTPATA